MARSITNRWLVRLFRPAMSNGSRLRNARVIGSGRRLGMEHLEDRRLLSASPTLHTPSAVASLPTIASLTASPAWVIFGPSATITLSAQGIDPGSSAGISTIELYRDSNHNGRLDVGIDNRLAVEKFVLPTQPSDPWTRSFASNNFELGVNTFFARVQDYQGTWSNAVAASCWIERDSDNPTVVTVDSIVTGSTCPTLTGTASTDSSGSISSVTVAVGGQTLVATVTGSTWAASLSNRLASGVYDVRAYATDDAGTTVSDATTSELTIDTTSPTISVDPLVTNDDNGTTVTGTCENPLSGVAEVQVVVAGRRVQAKLFETDTTNHVYNWNATVPTTLPNGTYNAQALATTPVGGAASDTSTRELIIDTRPPTIQVTRLVTRDSTPIVQGTVRDPAASNGAAGSGIAGVTVVVGGQTLTATVSGNVWVASVPTALACGVYNVVATAQDWAGNRATDGTAGELVVDTVAPVVTVASLTTGNARPTLRGTVSDSSPSSGIASVRVTVGNQSFAAIVRGTTWTAVVPVALSNGTYNVRVVARDQAGNVGGDSTNNELVVNAHSWLRKPRGIAAVALSRPMASSLFSSDSSELRSRLTDQALASYTND